MYITKQTKKKNDTGRPPKRKKVQKNQLHRKNSLPLTQTTEPTTEQMAFFFLKVLLLSKAKSDPLTQ